ncbi:MAG: archease [Candidatus Bathyarchaeota archaeon]|nr:archease [Candidatus Bathyarchaeota archaeon]MDH5623608.1 archease [Candidatus Bathyarchaeota archaeon]MDH5636220.1 archease [Candidatus Bathyarchaeota archaeon]MDH5701863.1 archease [Candidatus Bathyarchaeota archaeon]
MKKRFKFLEHTADAYVEAYGTSLEEAFENAALAALDVMTEPEKVEAKIEDDLEVEAPDEYALLYSWIEEILIKFELTGRLYSRLKISSIEKTPVGWKLKAKAWGELYDPEKHPSKVGIKSITYHQMEIVKKPKSATVRFILDV